MKSCTLNAESQAAHELVTKSGVDNNSRDHASEG